MIRFLLILFLLGNIPNLSAQSDSVDFENLNIPMLENLVKERIDSIRIQYGLSILKPDNILYKAALDHAVYLKNRRMIGHEQSSEEKRNAFKRAKYYGAENVKVVGENVAFDRVARVENYNKQTRETEYEYHYTYAQLADDIVEAWLQSETHFTNLKTPEYKFTGVAIVYDKRHKDFMCVQVFADYYD